MNQMSKIAILSSASGGGAGIAAKRICDALNHLGNFQADFIDIVALGEAVPASVTLNDSSSNREYTDTHYTAEYPGYVRGWVVALLSSYDVINVHWAPYLVTTSELIALAKMKRRILITMHDFYYCTGGCHYPAGCTGQMFSCVGCPQVAPIKFSRADVMAAYREKAELLGFANVHISAPSKYLVDAVVSTGIISSDRAHVIRNIYHPEDLFFGDKQNVKSHVLLVADSLVERRKGMRLALAALGQATAKYTDGNLIVHLVGQMDNELERLCAEHRINAVFHGRIKEHEKLAAVYRNSGILLTCSYEDNWPNVLVEGGAYGVVPVVGSGHGCEEFCSVFGIGHVVADYTPESFSETILKCIETYPSNEMLQVFATCVRDSHLACNVAVTYASTITDISTEGVQQKTQDRPRKDVYVVSNSYRKLVSQNGTSRIDLVTVGGFSPRSREFSGYGFEVSVYRSREKLHFN
ncbi:MAG: group 1 glycosyl transferase [Rhodocyclaceae bacterium]|nr:MAG: group 1 glycosyl transferase [Rhodocyclaceae bacterium]TNC98522.1 MAG: group 1 glycosyl transferase [Rhodocyclaceae bacterium]